MVLLEAQAFGLPIVSFQCKCGPLDVIEDGKTGFLIKDGDIQELANGIIRLIEDSTLRVKMGQAGRYASNRYDESCVMGVWCDLFSSLLMR